MNRLLRAAGKGLPILVFVCAAALRFDALTVKYGPVERPAVLRAIQQGSHGLLASVLPSGMRWDPVPLYLHRDGKWTRYSSDPYTYLQYAREMRSFYAAHYREPVFPFATRVMLTLLDNQDVAVSFASALFSVLAVVATYLLGALAFSRWVGLGAALALAIEYDVVSWSVTGQRDEAFGCLVVLFAYALVRHLRSPSRGSTIALGVVAGLACLTRLTAVSFVLPGLVIVLFAAAGRWRERWKRTGLAALVMLVVVGPYVANCWWTFGDPMYAINVHANVYRATEEQPVQTGLTAASYVSSKLKARPFGTADTFITGLTAYPFQNKWRGFAPWLPSLGTWLSWASLGGLFIFLGSGAGRVMLVVLFSSLVPFAVTWTLIADWRFTAHAYPFFLIAAAAFAAACCSVRLSWLKRVAAPGRAWLRPLAFWVAMLAAVAAAHVFYFRVMPVWLAEEALRSGDGVDFEAGSRDGSFFGRGWSTPVTGGNVTARISTGSPSIMWIALPNKRDYDMTVRLDPYPPPVAGDTPRRLRLLLVMNGAPILAIVPNWNPDRVGAYQCHIPLSIARKGFNKLTIVSDADGSGLDVGSPAGAGSQRSGGTFRMWKVRVREAGR